MPAPVPSPARTFVLVRTDLVRMTFPGDKAAEVVNGLVTNEVQALAAGEGCYAVALTPKGKVVADLRIFRTTEAVLTDVTAEAAPGWSALVKKFVNPRLTKYADSTAGCAFLEFYGDAVTQLGEQLGVAHTAPWSHDELTVDGVRCVWAWLPGLAGRPGAVLWCATDAAGTVVDALQARGVHAGSHEGLEVWRVLAGRPRWGIDVDDTMLSQEANMDELQAISYTKGCYTGQEFVARLHYRGHVNRFLRGLRLTAPIARGASVVTSDGTTVGDVRSSVESVEEGAIALALIRREVPDGTEVRAQLGDRTVAATVVALPFVR